MSSKLTTDCMRSTAVEITQMFYRFMLRVPAVVFLGVDICEPYERDREPFVKRNEDELAGTCRDA